MTGRTDEPHGELEPLGPPSSAASGASGSAGSAGSSGSSGSSGQASTGGPRSSTPGSAREVFGAFLRLGLTSFGGPVAHLGYFRAELVERRRWLSDGEYADIVALNQLLPGPASSKVGMAIGLHRAGGLGMLAAWAAFTLPSALALFAFAAGVNALGDVSGAGWVAGLKAAAVGVVAHAVLGMARTLTPDVRRGAIALLGLAVMIVFPGPLTQVGVIVGAAVLGLLALRTVTLPAGDAAALAVRVPRWVALVAGGLFVALLRGLPVLARGDGGTLGLADVFYRSGALVFGGGHVVLPLLEAQTVQPGLVAPDTFLAGYGAAQAVPGPLFSVAAFLGAVMTSPPSGVLGAVIALVAIFLPGALLVLATMPFWARLRSLRGMRRAIMGANAGVVGLLAAALWDPVITHGVTSWGSGVLAAVAFAALLTRRVPPWAVVVGCALLGALLL